MADKVVVQAYDPYWAILFSELRSVIWPHISDFAISIEHVGSTSVPGLASKPVIDMDIVIPDSSFLPLTIERLSALGYEHRGNLGIRDRDAFRNDRSMIKHHLYVCPENSEALRNHLCLRNSLRAHPKLRDEYAALKLDLAKRFPESMDSYVEGKTDFILKVLHQGGLSAEALEEIRLANTSIRKKSE